MQSKVIVIDGVSSAGKPGQNEIKMYTKSFGDKSKPAVLLLSGAITSARLVRQLLH